jgi:hypothetical protein
MILSSGANFCCSPTSYDNFPFNVAVRLAAASSDAAAAHVCAVSKGRNAARQILLTGEGENSR